MTYVSWVRPHDRWDDHVRRFHRACVKGFVGRYASLYDTVKAARETARRVPESEGGGDEPGGTAVPATGRPGRTSGGGFGARAA